MTSKALSSLFALTLCACSNLQPIDAGVCGNRIVEPDNGEDCDGGDNCGTGDDDACRITCSLDATAPIDCPNGFGCGIDGICRQPSGRFTVVETGPPSFSVNAADMDGDGQTDLFRTGLSESTAQFYDTDFRRTATTVLAQEPTIARPFLGPFTFGEDGAPDNRADLAVAVNIDSESSGLTIYRSQQDRSLTPTPYATFRLDARDVFGVAVSALAPISETEVMGFTSGPQGGVLVGIEERGQVTPLIIDESVDVLSVTGVASGSLIPGNACDELVWTSDTASRSLFIFETCQVNNMNQVVWNNATNVVSVALPLDLLLPKNVYVLLEDEGEEDLPDLIDDSISNVFVTDMDNDGDEDIAFLLRDPNGRPVYWLENVNDGTWEDNPLHHEMNVGFNEAVVNGPEPQVFLGSCVDDTFGWPLAIADLNRDGEPDYVTADSLWMSRRRLFPVMPVTFDYGDPVTECQAWDQAVLGDFDKNGSVDIAVSRAGEPGIDLAMNAGDGAFTWNVISTQRRVTRMSAGDYDGDNFLDLSLLEEGAFDDALINDDGESNELFVAYGSASGGFEQPVGLGTLINADAIVSGRFRGDDATDDILVPTRDENDVLEAAVFSGDGARQVVAPYAFRGCANNSVLGGPPQLFAMTGGKFSDVPGGGLAALTSFGDASCLWGLEVQGDAALFGAQEASVALPLCTGLCTLAAVDIDDDGLDELIVVGDRQGQIFEKEAGPNTPFALAGDIQGLDAVNATDFGQPIVVDFDGDGRKDVALVASNVIDGTPLNSEAIVFWNKGDGTLGLNAATRVALGANDASISAVQLDGDPGLELVVFVDEYDGFVESSTAFILEADSGVLARTPEEGSPLLVDDWTNVPEIDAQASGDFNGDGVPDLVVGGFNGYVLLKGEPVR